MNIWDYQIVKRVFGTLFVFSLLIISFFHELQSIF